VQGVVPGAYSAWSVEVPGLWGCMCGYLQHAASLAVLMLEAVVRHSAHQCHLGSTAHLVATRFPWRVTQQASRCAGWALSVWQQAGSHQHALLLRCAGAAYALMHELAVAGPAHLLPQLSPACTNSRWLQRGCTCAARALPGRKWHKAGPLSQCQLICPPPAAPGMWGALVCCCCAAVRC
jgi:hypothetical protein